MGRAYQIFLESKIMPDILLEDVLMMAVSALRVVRRVGGLEGLIPCPASRL